MAILGQAVETAAKHLLPELFEGTTEVGKQLWKTVPAQDKATAKWLAKHDLPRHKRYTTAVDNGDTLTMSSIADEGGRDARAFNEQQEVSKIGQEPVQKSDIDLLKEATEDTGTKGRNAESVVLSGGEASAGYGNLGVIDQGLKSQTGGAVTALHHAGFLNELVRGLKAHGSWQRWTEGVNPIVQLLKGKGYKLGHYFENIANVLDVMPKRARTAQKRAIQQHVSDLGGGMHDTTANALLRGSKNVLEMGGDVPRTELRNFEAFSKIDTELGRANTGEEFLDVQKFTEVDGKLKKIPDPKQKYPKIPVLYPEGHEFAGQLIKEWQPQNAAQYHNRYKRTLQILEQAGVNPDTVVKGWNRKAIKIDSNLEIFGADHKAIHAITEALKKRPGNPIYELEQLIKNDLIRDLPDERLAQIIEAQLETMETVLGNVLQKRYQVISDLFTQKYPNGYKGLGETFSELGAEAKQDFFLTHITEIARKGGQMNKKLLTLDEALVPLKGWDENITEVFGWKPQTQGRTSVELEPLVKEFQETVPTTQPIPGTV